MRKRIVLVVLVGAVSMNLFAALPVVTPKSAFVSTRDGNFEIYKMNLNGSSQQRLTNNPAIDTQPSVAKDGRIVFLSERDGNAEIYVMTASGANQTRLTNHPAYDAQPAWSPDGTKIVFESDRSGLSDIFIMNADGSGLTQLTDEPGFDVEPAFSPDGSKIVFSSDRDGNREIYVMNANGSGQTRLTNNTLFETRPEFSRTGQKIAFNRMVPQAGGGLSQQVAIMNANGTGVTVLTTLGTNANPSFSGDGTRIFFNSSRDQNPELYSMALDGSNQTRLTNNAASDTQPGVQPLIEADTIGVYRPTTGQWVLDNDSTLQLDIKVTFGGQPGDLPVSGDWNADGRTDIGVFRDGTFHLALLPSGNVLLTDVLPLPTFTFGQPGDLPLAGDWDGDGKDDVGVFHPGPIGTFLLRQPRLVNGSIVINTITFGFGTAGDLPFAGDWDGNGIDTPGVLRPDPNAGAILLTNSFANVVDHTVPLGGPGTFPVGGDWFARGHDDVGIYSSVSATLLLIPDLNDTKSLQLFNFGQPGDLPVAGSWSP